MNTQKSSKMEGHIFSKSYGYRHSAIPNKHISFYLLVFTVCSYNTLSRNLSFQMRQRIYSYLSNIFLMS